MYLITGNGTRRPVQRAAPTAARASSSCAARATPCSMVDWFTPYNYAFLEAEDRDLGSAGSVLDPRHQHRPRRRQGRKALRRSTAPTWANTRPRFRHGGDDSQITQTVDLTGATRPAGPQPRTPVYWKSQDGEFIYIMAEEDYLKQYRVVDGKLAAPQDERHPRAHRSRLAPNGYTMPGGTLALSADGDKPGSASSGSPSPSARTPTTRWCPACCGPSTPATSASELWNSLLNRARDDVGNYAKFNPATVYNGKVYVPTFSNRFCVYGLLGQ